MANKSAYPNLTVVDHPLVQHKLTLMRDKDTPTAIFRHLLREISLLLGYEVLRDLPMELRTIETPLGSMQAPLLQGKKVVVVSILRAGNGLLDGIIDLVPSARIGHIGIYRDPKTLEPVEYYFKVPDRRRRASRRPRRSDAGHRQFRLGRHSAPKERRRARLQARDAAGGAGRHRQARPPASRRSRLHRRGRLHLNEHGYIVPGLGDAGDRMFGTK